MPGNQKSAYVFGLVAVLLWSTVASAFKLTLRHIDHVQLLFYSSLFSTIILFVIVAGQGKLRFVFIGTAAHYRRSFLLGLLNPFLYYLILFKAYELLPAQEAQPLNYTWGLVLPVLSVPILRQKIGIRDAAALLLGYCGALVISTRGNLLDFRPSDTVGVALALGSAFVWALFWIYHTSDERDPVVCLLLSFSFSLPFTLSACILLSSVRLTDVYGLLGSTYVGAFEMSITFAVWLMALRHSENTAKVSSLIFIAPFFSLVFIHFILGEDIRLATIVGLVLIVAGLIAQKAPRRRTSGPRTTIE